MQVLGAVGSLAAFATVRLQGMPFGLPSALSWLLVVAAVWIVARAFTDLAGYRERAAKFAATLLEEEPNQPAQPTRGKAPRG